MKLRYSIDLDQSEKFLDLFVLGVLIALRNKAVSIDEAEGFIFKPLVADFLKQNISESLSEFIMNGCELEDYESLGLNTLDERIDTLVYDLLNKISQKNDFGRLVNKEIDIL